MRNPLPPDVAYELNDTDDGYILYFGRLSKEKGVKTLIDESIIAGVKLVILGTGPIEQELISYTKENGYDSVEFKGFQKGSALTDFIRKSRCVVLPSEWYENGPYSAMEAMALGKPLIVSDKGGLPELVEDGKNGYIYGGEVRLSDCLKKISAASREEYCEMCRESLNKAKTLFNPEAYAERLEGYYNDLKGNKDI